MMKVIEKSCLAAALVCAAVGIGLNIAAQIAEKKIARDVERKDKERRKHSLLYRII